MIEVTTLTDGGQTASDIAHRLSSFIAEAHVSLDIALYDFALSPAAAEPVVGAIRAVAARGVAVRLVHNVDHERPIPVPPPPRHDPSLIEACGVPTRGVPGIPDLMHHKYVVRDGRHLWTGSTNWTDDSWTREENVVVLIESPVVASAYTRDFEELWSTTTVRGSGEFDPRPDSIDGAKVQPWFSPGRGRRIAHRIAGAIGRADRRVRIASPVLTSGPILGTLTEVATTQRVDVAGVLDGTQMEHVRRQWIEDASASWKIPAFTCVAEHLPLSGKISTPYGPGTVHDYMHAKVTVADDVVFIGSYNLSHSGEENAENVLEIEDAGLADRMAAYIDEIRSRYPPLHWPDRLPATVPGEG